MKAVFDLETSEIYQNDHWNAVHPVVLAANH